MAEFEMECALLGPPVPAAVPASSFWVERMLVADQTWWTEARHIVDRAESLRPRAKFNTGSISVTAAVALRALCAWVSPQIVIEVGTFIGVSTKSLRASHIYTCDVSNDCLASTDWITCYPYQTSTVMFSKLLQQGGVKADLFFFDGLLSGDDVPLIQLLAAPDAVFVFDDYNGKFKGVQNVAKLQAVYPGYRLLPATGPVTGTTLAVLAPEARL